MTPPRVKTVGSADEQAAAPHAAPGRTLIPRSALRLQSDERLVKLVREGSGQAFEATVERYRHPLLKYCRRRLGADRCEDVVQQTFLNAHQALLADNRRIDLKPWLYTIAHNLAVNELAKKGFNHEQLDENYDGVPQPPQVFERQERFRSLIGRIENLPPRQRSALLLREFEGRDYHEIAGVFGSTVAAATELARRARINLRDALGLLVPLDSMKAWLISSSSTSFDPQRISELVRSADVGGGALKAGVAALLAGTIVAGAAVTKSDQHSANQQSKKDQGALVSKNSGGSNGPLDAPIGLGALGATGSPHANRHSGHGGGTAGEHAGHTDGTGIDRKHPQGNRPPTGSFPAPRGPDRRGGGEGDHSDTQSPHQSGPGGDGGGDHGLDGGPGPSDSGDGPSGGDHGDSGSPGPSGPDGGGGDDGPGSDGADLGSSSGSGDGSGD